MNSKRNIIFVYNAKGGKWNYILDTVHKYASPSTYECNLCKITHDLKMKDAWRKFIESSPHHFKFLHSEELEEYNRDYIEQSKIVVKFECREVGAKI